MTDSYWNHNVHYHPLVVDAVPDGCRTALDVSCGDGLPARKLASRAGSVTGVDRSPQMIRLARADVPPENVTFVEADYLDGISLDEGTYDFVSAVAVVHHTEFEDAVARLMSLLAPGGRLVIVGLAYNVALHGRVGQTGRLRRTTKRADPDIRGRPLRSCVRRPSLCAPTVVQAPSACFTWARLGFVMTTSEPPWEGTTRTVGTV